MKVLLFFIDGLGLGSNNPQENPIIAANTIYLDRILNNEFAIMIPTDATLGVKGIPQSATGQTTLFTGVNAAKIMGHHISGFPGPGLRKIIFEGNLFKSLKERGKKVTFANAYSQPYLKNFLSGDTKGSVTTNMVLSADLEFRLTDLLITGNAVYRDMTNKLINDLDSRIPLIKHEEAAKNLAKIVRENDLTLYEYFQTDRVGHKQNFEEAIELIENIDKFIGQVIEELDFSDTLLIITSDHGNIEDLSVKTHTLNMVPTILIGAKKEEIEGKIRSLTDITPAILELFV
ncbi:alkaline phosphatase family protein [Natronospora cellulosivora (SeqCode)]